MSNSRKCLNSKLGKCSLYYCSVHKWILEAYSIEILGNYSVTCRLYLKPSAMENGTEFIIYYTV